MKNSRIITGVAAALLLLSLGGCEKKEPTIGERVDDAVESVNDAAQDAGETMSEAAEDASDALSEAAEDAKQKANE